MTYSVENCMKMSIMRQFCLIIFPKCGTMDPPFNRSTTRSDEHDRMLYGCRVYK